MYTKQPSPLYDANNIEDWAPSSGHVQKHKHSADPGLIELDCALEGGVVFLSVVEAVLGFENRYHNVNTSLTK